MGPKINQEVRSEPLETRAEQLCATFENERQKQHGDNHAQLLMIAFFISRVVHHLGAREFHRDVLKQEQIIGIEVVAIQATYNNTKGRMFTYIAVSVSTAAVFCASAGLVDATLAYLNPNTYVRLNQATVTMITGVGSSIQMFSQSFTYLKQLADADQEQIRVGHQHLQGVAQRQAEQGRQQEQTAQGSSHEGKRAFDEAEERRTQAAKA